MTTHAEDLAKRASKALKLSPEGVRHVAKVANHTLASVYENSPRYRDAVLLLYMCEEVLGEHLVSQKDFERFPPTLFKDELSWQSYPTTTKRPASPRSGPRPPPPPSGASTAKDPLSQYGLGEGRASGPQNPWNDWQIPRSATGPNSTRVPPRNFSTTTPPREASSKSRSAHGSKPESKQEFKITCTTCHFAFISQRRALSCPACGSNAISIRTRDI